MHSLERPPSYPEKVESSGGRLLFQLRLTVSGGEGLVNLSFGHYVLIVILGRNHRAGKANVSVARCWLTLESENEGR